LGVSRTSSSRFPTSQMTQGRPGADNGSKSCKATLKTSACATPPTMRAACIVHGRCSLVGRWIRDMVAPSSASHSCTQPLRHVVLHADHLVDITGVCAIGWLGNYRRLYMDRRSYWAPLTQHYLLRICSIGPFLPATKIS
jgi:hypothetical protein